MNRRAAALLLAAVLAAGEEAPVAVAPTTPAPAVMPALLFKATGGMSLSLSPARPSEAKGVQLRYEDIILETEILRYRMAVLAGAARPVLSTADLIGGPDGRVLIDTSASKLERIAFRGQLRPRTVAVRRVEPDPARPKTVGFRLECSEVGDVHGIVATATGPRQILAWAERVILDLEAEVDPASSTGMSVPRLVTMHLYGPPANPAGDERLALVLVMINPVPAAEAIAERQWSGTNWALHRSADWMALEFDETGALAGYKAGNKGEYAEQPGQGLILRRVPTSVPVIGK
jgi:hypothetical protein